MSSWSAPRAEDFSDIGFASGLVRGLRSFQTNPDGMLTGVVHRQIWFPGETPAYCLKSVYTEIYAEGYGTDLTHIDFPPPDHEMTDCEHGLYAYYNGENYYAKASEDRIAGVIEGYGKVVIGKSGFRAMKASIVALCYKTSNKDIDLILENYSDIPWFASEKAMVAEFPLGEFLE